METINTEHYVAEAWGDTYAIQDYQSNVQGMVNKQGISISMSILTFEEWSELSTLIEQCKNKLK